MSFRLPTCLAALFALVLPCPAAPAGEAARGKKYALLVGVLKYDHASLGDLEHTEHDVDELARLLGRPGSGFAEVVVLSSTRGKKDAALAPTAKNFRDRLRKLTDKVKKHDLLLVALSGHGLQVTVTDPDTKKEKEESFFCPSDARPRSNQSLAELKKTMIPLSELFRELEESGAGVKLLLVDACRNDPGRGRNVDVDALPAPPRGMAALFSCKSGERAFESSKLGRGHGVFFYHVIQALEGKAANKGQVTWNRLTEYVTANVSAAVPRLIGGGAKQTPHEIKNLVGSPPVLLDTSGEARRLFLQGVDAYLGNKGKINLVQALRLFRQAGELGYDPGRAVAGTLLVLGQGTVPDVAGGKKMVESALPGLREAARQGEPFAQTVLAFQYRDARVLRGDDEEAVKWFLAAANGGKGVGFAMFGLGRMYEEGRGVEQDDGQAVAWYSKGAAVGDAASLNALGWMYATGRGAKQDDRQAVVLFRRAAQKELPPAFDSLGVMYCLGRGVKQDDKRAVGLFRAAAERGDAGGMYNLAWMAQRGRGMLRDDRLAVAWLRRAVAWDYPLAMNDLGALYRDGLGVEKDDKQAAAWFRKAADRGVPAGMENLARLYEQGRGVKRSRAEALKWYRKAADKGLDSARKKVRELEKAGP